MNRLCHLPSGQESTMTTEIIETAILGTENKVRSGMIGIDVTPEIGRVGMHGMHGIRGRAETPGTGTGIGIGKIGT